MKKLIAEQYARAKDILRENADGHAKLAKILLEKEIIYANDLEEIFGKRRWVSRSQELLQQDQDTIQQADALQSLSRSKDESTDEIFIHENEKKKDKTASSELNKTDQTVEKKDDKETTKDNSIK